MTLEMNLAICNKVNTDSGQTRTKPRLFARGTLRRAKAHWDQVSNMVVVGLFFWICIQNDNVANTAAGHIITQLENTIIHFLNGTGF